MHVYVCSFSGGLGEPTLRRGCWIVVKMSKSVLRERLYVSKRMTTPAVPVVYHATLDALHRATIDLCLRWSICPWYASWKSSTSEYYTQSEDASRGHVLILPLKSLRILVLSTSSSYTPIPSIPYKFRPFYGVSVHGL